MNIDLLELGIVFVPTKEAETKQHVVKNHCTVRQCCTDVLFTGAVKIIVIHLRVIGCVVFCCVCAVRQTEGGI